MSPEVLKGKNLFMSKCASCHTLFKNMTGPGLAGVIERGPWTDRKELYKWIRNPEKYMQTNTYTAELKRQFGTVMQAFPNLTDEEIDLIVEYIKFSGSASGQ